jgi:hypothetical protein
MPDMRWYGINLQCGVCKNDTVLQAAGYSADGEMSFTFYCTTCKEAKQWRVFASQLCHMALLNDACSVKRHQQPRPLIPPVKPPPEKMTKEDRKMFHDYGIIPPEEGGK